MSKRREYAHEGYHRQIKMPVALVRNARYFQNVQQGSIAGGVLGGYVCRPNSEFTVPQHGLVHQA
jgi:hypothetical protein